MCIRDRPLIEKNTTNSVSVISSEIIQTLPIRGVNDIVSLQAGVVIDGKESERQKFEGITARKNLNETAFFFPELRTNEDGEILLSLIHI